MEKQRKVIDFGKIAFYGNRKINKVTIEIKLKETPEGLELSISGNVWNNRESDIITGGQCLDDLLPYFENNKPYKEIYRLWKNYHLNGMNAGTKEQTKAINDYLEKTNKRYKYSEMCEYLKNINLYQVEYNGKPYLYGHGWIFYEIPTEDIKIIQGIINNN